MRIKYCYLLLLTVFFSCSSEEKTESGGAEDFNFSYTVDTVMVDAGDHFVYLQQNLGSSDITPDGRYLLNFNGKETEMEIVDLDELKLSSVVKLEQEGPNGIGTSASFFTYKAISKDEIMFASWEKLIKLDLSTKSTTNYSLKNENLPQGSMAPNEELRPGGLFSSNGATFYSWYGVQEKPYEYEGLAKIDLKSLEINVIPIPQMDKLDQFTIDVEISDGITGKFGESIGIIEVEDKIILQPSAINEFWVMDKPTQEVTVKVNQSNLTENIKAGDFTNKITSREAFKEARDKMRKGVSFGSLVHDSDRDLLWRISSDLDHMNGEAMVRNFYLTFFDLDLNQIGEFKLENWELTGKVFIKDGDFYQFINIEDEMAFVRLKPTRRSASRRQKRGFPIFL